MRWILLIVLAACVNPHEDRDLEVLRAHLRGDARCEFAGNHRRPYVYLCATGGKTLACIVGAQGGVVMCNERLPVTAEASQ